MLNSPTCYSGHQNGERIERFSRKVFVGGLPPDIDEGELEANEVWREGKREKTKWVNESNPPSKIMLYNRLQLASSCFVFNEMSMLMGMLRLVSLDVIHSFWFWEVLFISDSTLADCRVPYDAWNLLLMLYLAVVWGMYIPFLYSWALHSILYLYFFIYSQEMPISNWISNCILPEHLRSGLEKLILFLFRNRETRAEEGQVAKPCVMHWIQKIPRKSRLLCDAIGIALYNSADLK